MPTTKKENFYFGMIMCVGMVLTMTVYNLVINDMLGHVPVTVILVQLVLGFIVAFLLELFIVGPAAHKLAFSLPYDKSKEIYGIVILSFFMVTGMVLLMSLFGLGMACFFGELSEPTILESYGTIAFHNFIFALPLQLLIMGPLVRFLFARFVKGQPLVA